MNASRARHPNRFNPPMPMTPYPRFIAAGAVLSLMLGGCATEYACPIPQADGGCRSVAQVYQDTLNDDDSMTPSAGAAKPASPAAKADVVTRLAVAASASPALQPTSPGDALLSTPRVLRVDLFPWQDSDGDLEGGGDLYLRLDRGEWKWTTTPKP